MSIGSLMFVMNHGWLLQILINTGAFAIKSSEDLPENVVYWCFSCQDRSYKCTVPVSWYKPNTNEQNDNTICFVIWVRYIAN